MRVVELTGIAGTFGRKQRQGVTQQNRVFFHLETRGLLPSQLVAEPRILELEHADPRAKARELVAGGARPIRLDGVRAEPRFLAG